MADDQPSLYVVAGPNGAGKSTFARRFLPEYADCREFVNADLIAASRNEPEMVVLSVADRQIVFDRGLFARINSEVRDS